MDNKTIYILVETLEKWDGLREFNIIATSFDINKLIEMLKNEIQDDKYDFIKKNGISYRMERGLKSKINTCDDAMNSDFVITGIESMEIKNAEGVKILDVNPSNELLNESKPVNQFIKLTVPYTDESFKLIKDNNIEIQDFTINVDTSKWDIGI